MLGWQNPAALWALSLLALPVVIHLLRTHHARRVAFPTLRFVQLSRTAAVRMRAPSDVALMVIRIAIVALAVAAIARPILLTDARISAWNARIARAVVVDVSDSMRARGDSDAAPEAAAAEAAEAELKTASDGVRFDAVNLEDGVTRASRWLASRPPARREVVVISDLQPSALETSFAGVAEGTGLRFVPVGRPAMRTSFDGVALFGTSDVESRRQRVEATPDSTAVAIDAHPDTGMPGVRVVASPAGEQRVARLLRAVAMAGAPAGSVDQPIAIRLAGAPAETSAAIAPITAGWMLRTVLRLREHPSIAASDSLAPSSTPGTASSQPPWFTIANGADGRALVRAAASNRELVLDVAASANDLFAAVVVQAALAARIDPAAYDEHEIARLDDASLAAMTRQAAPVTREAWRTAETTDARWCWLLALILMAVEQWFRARHARHRSTEVARAAA